VDELEELFSFPTAVTFYSFQDGEILTANQETFVFTNDWIFRVHVEVRADRIDDYDAEKFAGWIESLTIGEMVPKSDVNGVSGGDEIVLTPGDADLAEGEEIVVEGDPSNLGGWHGDNAVVFRVDLERAGSYAVSINYSKQEFDGDEASLRIEVTNDESGDEKTGLYQIPTTGPDWSNYEDRELGTLIGLEAGASKIRLVSSEPASGSYVMNLRSVTLRRVDE
jgi:hypothetical protein